MTKLMFSIQSIRTILAILVFNGSCLTHGQNGQFEAYQQKLPGVDETIKMVPIKSGEFFMGSMEYEKGRNRDEGAQHKVSIDAFWMAEVEITWDIYQLFISRENDNLKLNLPKGSEVSIDIDAVSGATTPYVEMSFGMGTEGYPAISMTQYAASKFCEWLSALTGYFYRLPTEAEWEYACRAGTMSAYSFGDNVMKLEEYAWFSSNSEDKYQEVGQKKPNAWGLYDMHGNVAEWTLDAYDDEAYSNRKGKQTNNPFVKPTRTYPRSVRGGSWMDKPEKLRCAARRYSKKEWKIRDPQIPKSKWWHTDAPFVGFRIVRPYKTPSEKEQKEFWKEKHNN
jgi:formylglycine-generating enzyme required for sulfatase activity